VLNISQLDQTNACWGYSSDMCV